MRERGDLTVLHEPFMYFFYLSKAWANCPHFHPDPTHPTDYEGIRDMIRTLAETGPVFVKDMAYYVLPELLDDLSFSRNAHHAFLVRQPVEAILSYAKLDPDFTSEEVGIEGQWQLFTGLVEAGLDPIVLRSEALRSDPKGQIGGYWRAVGLEPKPAAFEWNSDLPDGWQHVKDWHDDVLQSGAIRPPDNNRDQAQELALLPDRFTEMCRHHQTFYEKLIAFAD